MAIPEDRPYDDMDWGPRTLGPRSYGSVRERRSTIWNDDGILDGTAPDTFYEAVECKGKFFPRGCRGMIEELQLYCIGDAADTVTLRYSPHPCLGPFGEVTITPAAAWAWQAFVIEAMWDYDSLFIWLHEIGDDVDWAYDAELPYDGHESPCCAIEDEAACRAAGCFWDGDSCNPGGTWADWDARPFIRAVYTGETPGDVPVSGIINNIPIPSTSSILGVADEDLPDGVDTQIYALEGAGYCDYIEFIVDAAANSHWTTVYIYCDGELAAAWGFDVMSALGCVATTPTISLATYGANARCCFLIHKRFEFRRSLEIRALNAGGAQTVDVWVHPTLLR